jgi:hypothetical protein
MGELIAYGNEVTNVFQLSLAIDIFRMSIHLVTYLIMSQFLVHLNLRGRRN